MVALSFFIIIAGGCVQWQISQNADYDDITDYKIVTSEMSKEIAILKKKAIEQIKTDLRVINLTHHLPHVNNIGYIKEMYTRAPENKQEKALWGVKVIGY